MSETAEHTLAAPEPVEISGITRMMFDDGSWIIGPGATRFGYPLGKEGGAKMEFSEDGMELGTGPSGSAGRLEFEPHAKMPLHVHLSAAVYADHGNGEFLGMGYKPKDPFAFQVRKLCQHIGTHVQQTALIAAINTELSKQLPTTLEANDFTAENRIATRDKLVKAIKQEYPDALDKLESFLTALKSQIEDTNPFEGFDHHEIVDTSPGEFELDDTGKPIPMTNEEIKARWAHKSPERHFVQEFIEIDKAGGPLLLQIGDRHYFVPPGSRFCIKDRMPHTWSGVPVGIKMPDITLSDGTVIPGGVTDGRKAIMHFRYGEPIIGFTAVKTPDRVEGLASSLPEIPKEEIVYFADMDAEKVCTLPYVMKDKEEHGGLSEATHKDKIHHLVGLVKNVVEKAQAALGIPHLVKFFAGIDTGDKSAARAA